jgi:hypothetical protein
MTLSADELLAGSQLTYEIEVPAALLAAKEDAAPAGPRSVVLRPLSVRDLQLVSRAAKENDEMLAALMVQRSLVAPEMSVGKVVSMPVGLMQFLLQEVNRISGITTSPEFMTDTLEAPLVKAAFVLAKEFGWTPDQFNALTMGQIMLHLQKLREERGV